MKKGRPTPFLLLAEARSKFLDRIYTGSDEELHAILCRARWPKTDGCPICPQCGEMDVYANRQRRQWKCKRCGKVFSVTSGTVFHSSKLPIRKLLVAVLLYANAGKGISAIQVARQINVQHKTAFVLMHKIREILLRNRSKEKLAGVVQVDGAYVFGTVRKVNRPAEPQQKGWLEDRKAKAAERKRCILVLRELDEKNRPVRTITKVVRTEAHAQVHPFIMEWVSPGATIVTDENSAYSRLAHDFAHVEVVNHAKNFRGEKSIQHINFAESYFARFRRCYAGQVHKMSVHRLDAYANEIAYREDTRRLPNGMIFDDILTKTLRPETRLDEWTYYSYRLRRRAGARERSLPLAA